MKRHAEGHPLCPLNLHMAFCLAFVPSQIQSIELDRKLCLNPSILKMFWERGALLIFSVRFTDVYLHVCLFGFFDHAFMISSNTLLGSLSLLHLGIKYTETELQESTGASN